MEAKFGPNPVSAQRGQLNAKLNEIRSEFHVLSEQVAVMILGIGGSRAETVKTHIVPDSGRKLTHLEAKPLTPLRGNTVGNPDPQAEKNVPGWRFLDEINLVRNNDKFILQRLGQMASHSQRHARPRGRVQPGHRSTNHEYEIHKPRGAADPEAARETRHDALLQGRRDVWQSGSPSQSFPHAVSRYSWGTMRMDPANQPVEVGPAPGSPAQCTPTSSPRRCREQPPRDRL